MTGPVTLIVLDGWGIGSDPDIDAIKKANTPFYDSLLQDYPNTVMGCSGEDVGLPEGQMGNSEVGHLNLGAGRIVYQDYARINKSIKEGTFMKVPAFQDAIKAALSNNSSLHLLGLLSDGGVHSHMSHLYALIDMAVATGVRQVNVHAFMDGRDTPPTSGIGYIKELESYINDKPTVRIATVTGRFWVMDRDNRWDRIEKAYRCLVLGEGEKAESATEAVEKSYAIDETDEFIKPTIIDDSNGPTGNINDNDSVVFFNFRADRAREITTAITDDNFDDFKREKLPKLSSYVTMTRYDDDFPFAAGFPPLKLTEILGEVISRNSLKQLRIAETEKYAHVTYFFNGGDEEPFKGEDRCLIESPKDVATYDQKPEMSAFAVTDEVIERLDRSIYDFVLLNFANPDMVGHTGYMDAAVTACEAIDRCLEKIISKVQSIGGTAIITADHGNCEKMFAGDESHTAHTTNLVPFIIVKKGITVREIGILADVAPTVLDLMGLEKPEEMTGRSMIVKDRT